MASDIGDHPRVENENNTGCTFLGQECKWAWRITTGGANVCLGAVQVSMASSFLRSLFGCELRNATLRLKSCFSTFVALPIRMLIDRE